MTPGDCYRVFVFLSIVFDIISQNRIVIWKQYFLSLKGSLSGVHGDKFKYKTKN